MSKETIPPSQIFARLFIGGRKDVKEFEGVTINVLDFFPNRQMGRFWEVSDRAEGLQKLEEVTNKIKDVLWSGKKLLVYCTFGTQFAPTVVIYFLMKMGMSKTEAVAFMKAKRPRATPHLEWLPKEVI